MNRSDRTVKTDLSVSDGGSGISPLRVSVPSLIANTLAINWLLFCGLLSMLGLLIHFSIFLPMFIGS